MFGSLITAYFGADLIHWYAQPPFAMGCDCGQAIRWAMGKQVLLGGIGWLLGAIALSAMYGVLAGKKKSEKTA
jgi:hypothetical protein